MDDRVGKPVWRPTRLKPGTVDSFLAKGREALASTGTPGDAALTHLHENNYNTKPALHQLRQDNTRALPMDLIALNAMTTDDINAFEKAVGQVGKSFHDIAARMEYSVPVPTLILFYFARWKGTEAFEKWKQSWNQWKNNDSCYVCGQTSCSVENFLLCCDGCPLAYHNLCCDPPVAKDDVPEDSWYCQHCKSAKGKGKPKKSAATVPVQSWKENAKLEVRHEATQKWFAACIVMVSKKRVKIAYDGWNRKYDEWVMKTAAYRLAPLGTHVAKDSTKEVPDFARPQSLPTKLKTRNFVRKPGQVRIRIEHLEDAEANYAREWIRAANNILKHRKGEPYVPIVLQKQRPEPVLGSTEDGDLTSDALDAAALTEDTSVADSPGGVLDATAVARETDGMETETAATVASDNYAAGAAVSGPSIREVVDLLEKIKDISAHIDTEAELVTLEDAALEWLARASQTSILGSFATQLDRKSHYDTVVSLLEDADELCLDLDGASKLRTAVDETDLWTKQVQDLLKQEYCEEKHIQEAQRVGAELKVELQSTEDLLKQLKDRLEAQELDAKIKLALQVPTQAADLLALYDRAKEVNSTSATFTELGRMMDQTGEWQARAHDALTTATFTVAEMRTLVDEGEAWAARRVLVNGVEELGQAIAGAEKWLEIADKIEWDCPEMGDLRAVQKASIQLGVKAKIPELDRVRDTVENANTWLGDFRRCAKSLLNVLRCATCSLSSKLLCRLVPKRVNKKELHRLSTIDDLQHLLDRASDVGVSMEEIQQLKVRCCYSLSSKGVRTLQQQLIEMSSQDVVASSNAVLRKIDVALAEPVHRCGPKTSLCATVIVVARQSRNLNWAPTLCLMCCYLLQWQGREPAELHTVPQRPGQRGVS